MASEICFSHQFNSFIVCKGGAIYSCPFVGHSRVPIIYCCAKESRGRIEGAVNNSCSFRLNREDVMHDWFIHVACHLWSNKILKMKLPVFVILCSLCFCLVGCKSAQGEECVEVRKENC